MGRSVCRAPRRSGPVPAAPEARRRAATWQAKRAVLDPDSSLARREGWPRPSWVRVISAVRGSLREQRGGSCLTLCELHVPCVAGSPRPAGHLLTWQRCTLLTHSTRPTARRHTMVRSENRFLSAPSFAASLQAARARADHARWAACTLHHIFI